MSSQKKPPKSATTKVMDGSMDTNTSASESSATDDGGLEIQTIGQATDKNSVEAISEAIKDITLNFGGPVKEPDATSNHCNTEPTVPDPQPLQSKPSDTTSTANENTQRTENKKKTGLLDLPAELPLPIYAYAFSDLKINGDARTLNKNITHPPLLQVTKLLRNEAMQPYLNRAFTAVKDLKTKHSELRKELKRTMEEWESETDEGLKSALFPQPLRSRIERANGLLASRAVRSGWRRRLLG